MMLPYVDDEYADDGIEVPIEADVDVKDVMSRPTSQPVSRVASSKASRRPR